MLHQRSTNVAVSFDVAKERLAALSEGWFEDAARAAVDEAEAARRAGRPSLDDRRPSQVRITVWGPFAGRSVFALPLQWEVAGAEGTWALKGELEMFRVDTAQTTIGLMLSSQPSHDTSAYGMPIALRAFLSRVSRAVRGRPDREAGEVASPSPERGAEPPVVVPLRRPIPTVPGDAGRAASG